MADGIADRFARSVAVMRALEAACARPADWRDDIVEDALDALRPLTGAEMASLSYWDPLIGAHRAVVNVGYPDDVAALCDSVIHTDVTFQSLRAKRTPLRLHGLSGAQLGGAVGTQIIQRNRFRDGLTHCFFSREGRYLGYMNLSTSARYLDDSSCDVVQLIESAVAPLLARASRSTRGEASEATRGDGASLTVREREVLSQLPSGATNAAIAAALGISTTTVARHIEHIITKLGVPNRTRAACLAVEWGLSPAAA